MLKLSLLNLDEVRLCHSGESSSGKREGRREQGREEGGEKGGVRNQKSRGLDKCRARGPEKDEKGQGVVMDVL